MPRKVGRPRNAIRPVEWFIHVPEDIAAIVELDCLNPVTGKPRAGARSKLIEMLLRQHYAEKLAKPNEGGQT